jgi:uncharacterized membrane protein YdjX (TVP38/TMEM64 family)
MKSTAAVAGGGAGAAAGRLPFPFPFKRVTQWLLVARMRLYYGAAAPAAPREAQIPVPLEKVQAMTNDPPETATARFSPWRLLPLAVIAVGLVAFFAFGMDAYMSFEALRDRREVLLEWKTEHHGLAVFYFIGIYVLITAISVPGAVWLTIAGGFLFGVVECTTLVVIGATLGALAVFLAARYAIGDYLHAKAGPAMRRMEEGFQENALSYLLVLRLVPLFPFWLVNLVPAFLGVPIRTFAIGTFFGIIPGSFVFAGVGNGLGAVIDGGGMPDLSIIFEPEILFPIIGLAVLALVPVAYKKLKAQKA